MPKKRPDRLAARVRRVQLMFYFNALVWFLLGSYLMALMYAQHNGIASVLVGLFLYVNAVAMFISGRFLGRREVWAYYFSIFVLIINGAVTRVGQFGLTDQLALLFDVLLLILLLAMHTAYLHSHEAKF